MEDTLMLPRLKWPLILLVIAITISGSRLQAATDTSNTIWLAKPLSTEDARHLISRTGIGVTVAELLALKGLTRGEAVDQILTGFRQSPHQPMPAWTNDTAPVYWTRQDLSAQDKRRFDRKRDSELVELRQWWIDTLLTTDSPQTERMVLFWHDHFATSYHSINRQSIAMARQNQTFRELGMGNFKTLVQAMIRDPALLNYLDNLSNRKGSPNENLARELLELFTLGEGNYQEQTVREAARALTGFNVSQNKNLSFEYQTWSHDTGRKNLFGKSDHYDSDDLVDLIFEQDALASFIANKFWHAFVADHPPSAQELKSLATSFKDRNYNITALYRSVLESEAFWSESNRASLVKSPAQLIIGFARALDYPSKLNQQIPALMARSGMDLFAPPNVAGWTEGAAWITSGRLLNRYNAIDVLNSSNEDSYASLPMKENAMLTTSENSMSAEMSGTMASSNTDKDSSAMMASNNMMMQKPDSVQTLKLQLAGENYQGPVSYRVELLNAENNALWNSGNQNLPGGHDTRKYGRIRNTQDLPWQTVHFDVDKSTAAEAQFLRVHFLNDNGGDDGDRNMFVNGAEFGDQWIDSSMGKQDSKCPPSSEADAGNLYCDGTVSLSLENLSTPQSKSARAGDIQASSVHVQWVRWLTSNNQLDLTLTLQNMQTSSDFFPVYSIHLKSFEGGEPQLELNTYGCWPDCVTAWPDCSWEDKIDPSRKSLIFPLSGAGGNSDYQCHLDSLSSNEKTLIDRLMVNAPSLLNAASNTHREFSGKQKKAIEQWQVLFNKYQDKFGTESTARHDNGFTIDKKWQRTKPPRRTAVNLTPVVHSLQQLQVLLRKEGITLSQLLLPGIDQQQLSGFENLSEESLALQLTTLISSPVFQLH